MQIFMSWMTISENNTSSAELITKSLEKPKYKPKLWKDKKYKGLSKRYHQTMLLLKNSNNKYKYLV